MVRCGSRRAVVHAYDSQFNVMRTIEQILGLAPMNQQDLTAEPMYDDFTDKPDYAPQTYLRETLSLDQRNPTTPTLRAAAPLTGASSPAGVAKPRPAWARWAQHQDWGCEEMANMAQDNRDIWCFGHGFTVPYPDDSRVLFPSQIPGGGTLTRPGAFPPPDSSPGGGHVRTAQ